MATGTLLLDLDGTMVDSALDLLAAGNRLMAAKGLPPFELPAVRPMIGDGVPALVRRMLTAHGRAEEPGDVEAFTADYMEHLADATRPFPGMEAAMRELAAEGWRLAVCTNKPAAAARHLLDTLGLLPLLAAVGGGDSYNVRKPDPGHLLGTLADAGGEPGTALAVGDHRNDVLAAQGASIALIFAGWGYGPPEMADGAVAVADTPADLPGIVRRFRTSRH